MESLGKKALKAGTWYTICTFILKGLAFITMPIFSRIMSVDDVGIYANYVSWIGILTAITTLDLFNSVNLAHYEFGESRIYEYLSSSAVAGSVVTAVLYFIAYILRDSVMEWLEISEYMLHVMFIYFLVSPAVSLLHAKFRVAMQYKYTIITSLIPAITSVLLGLVLVLVSSDEDKLNGRVTGYYGVWIVASVGIYIYVLLRGRTVKWKYIRFALTVAAPLVVHTMANTILSSSDRIMIKKLCGNTDTAYYAIAYSCAMVISILWQSVNQAWSPWCFEKMHNGEEKDIIKVAKPIILLFSGGVMLIILMAPELLYLMGGKKYVHAIYVVPPVMLGYVAQMLYTLYVNIEYFHKKQKQIMVGTLIAAAINIILNLIFIPIFGYVAAAYTTLAGYISLLLIHYLFVRKMGKHGIYNMKFNLIVLVSSIVLGISITLLYKLNPVRWALAGGIILFLTCFVAKHKAEMIGALKKKDIVGLLKICKLM